jgi:NADH dehydrogenase
MTGEKLPRVVIIGGGFAGLYAAKALAREKIELTVLDRNNHNTFAPLLYQVAMAVLAPSEIASPIRWLLKRQTNTSVLLADVERVDVARRVVIADAGKIEIPYDYLIVATGSRHSYFSHPEWEPLAPGLKTVEDAREIRRRFLLAYEMAEKASTERERDELMTFVIVGGGPTGVELAGILPEVGKRGITGEFRRADTTRTRTILLEGGPRILPAFNEEISAEARRELTELGVDVRTGALVTRIERDAVYVGDEKIPCRTVFWAAGNQASPLAKTLGVPLDKVGRVKVSPDLSVPGHSEIFVTGDLAVVEQDGALVPGVAPAAMQEGKRAAKNIRLLLRGKPTRAFRYFDKGNVATIGRHKAVAQFGDFGVTGAPAWFLWLFIHILYLAGFRNRLIVAIEWGYAYFTYQRGARVISEERTAAGSGKREAPRDA